MGKTTTAKTLERLMTVFNIGPTELGRKTGVGQSTITRIKGGQISSPRDTHIAALAAFFGVTVDQLRGREVIDWSRFDGIPNLRKAGELLSTPHGQSLTDTIDRLASKGVPEAEALEAAVIVLQRLEAMLAYVRRR